MPVPPPPQEAKQPERMTPEELQPLLDSWRDLKSNLEALKDAEIALRTQIVTGAFPELLKPDTKGTLTFEFPDKSQIKTTAKFNVKVNAELLSSIKDELITNELIPIDMLFTYKPSLSTSNYDKLTKEQKLKLVDILIFERASPDLKFIEPKEESK